MTKLHDTISRSTAASCPVCIISPYRFGITSSHSVSTPLPSDSIRDTHSRLDRSRIIALVPVPVLFLRVLVSLHFLDGRSRLRSHFHFETSLSILEHPHRLYPSHFPSPPNIFHPHPAPDRPRVPRSHSVITLFHQATIGPLCLINLAPPFAHEIPSLLRKGEVSSGLSPLEIDIGQVLNLRRDTSWRTLPSKSVAFSQVGSRLSTYMSSILCHLDPSTAQRGGRACRPGMIFGGH